MVLINVVVMGMEKVVSAKQLNQSCGFNLEAPFEP
jgi:hypothetical protein